MFINQSQAGKLLGERLKQEPIKEAVVLSLASGGVKVGKAAANLLDLPHSVIVAKRVVQPRDEELALGAISESKNSLCLNERLIKELKIPKEEVIFLVAEAVRKVKETKSQLALKREVALEGKVIILIDDGAATGATMTAAVREARGKKAKRIIVGLPVAPKETAKTLEKEADEVIVLERPEIFFSVSQFYENFPQVSLEETKKLLS